MSLFKLFKSKPAADNSAKLAKDRLHASVKHSNLTAHRIKQKLSTLLADLLGDSDFHFTHDKQNSRLTVSIPVED